MTTNAVQSSYSERHAAAVAGMIANMREADVDSFTCETSAGIGFGLAVGNGSAEGGVVLGASAATGFRGVSVKDMTLVKQESQTVDKYQQYDTMGVLIEGDIWVTVDGAVSRGNNVTFDSTTGKFGTIAADSTHFLVTNAQWMTGAADGGLAILRLAAGNAGT